MKLEFVGNLSGPHQANILIVRCPPNNVDVPRERWTVHVSRQSVVTDKGERPDTSRFDDALFGKVLDVGVSEGPSFSVSKPNRTMYGRLPASLGLVETRQQRLCSHASFSSSKLTT